MPLLIPNLAANDQVLPRISIQAIDAVASENPLGNGIFRISRTGATTDALAVRTEASGTATSGDDYQAIATIHTIPSGSSFVDVDVIPVDDSLVEDNETVILTVLGDPAYALSLNTTATVTITSEDEAAPTPSTVEVQSTDDSATEGGDTGEFTFTRTTPFTSPLTVLYTVSGSIGNGVDIVNLPGSIEIPATQDTATLTVTAIADGIFEPQETVTVTITENASYVVGSNDSATVNIISTDPENPAIGQAYAVFDGLTEMPVGWTDFGVEEPDFSGEGVNFSKGANAEPTFRVSQVRSPEFIPQDNQVIEIEYRAPFEFSAIGIGNPNTWGQFSVADALVALQDDIHNGQVAVQSGIGYAGGRLMRLRYEFHSGVNSVNLQVRSQTGAPGVYVLTYENDYGVHPSWKEGMRVFVDLLSGDLRTLAISGVLGDDDYLTNSPVPQNFYGYNFPLLSLPSVGITPADDTLVANTIRSIGGKTLRIPGGDPANFWDWDDGALIGDAKEDEFGDGRRDPAGLDRTPEPLPVWLRYEVNRVGFTIPNLEPLITQAVSVVTWCVNINTSGIQGVETALDKEIRHIGEAISAGIPIRRVELGNELYFGIPNYVSAVMDGDPSHSTRDQYAATANKWAQAIRTAYPDLEIYAIGTADLKYAGDRERNWNYSLDSENIWPNIDGITIHPYYDITDIGAELADVGNATRAEELALASMEELRTIFTSPSLGVLPDGQKIIITEHGILEDVNNPNTGRIVMGQSWVAALILDAHNHFFLQDPRIVETDLHVLTGNAQWNAMTGDTGLHVDGTKRGTQDDPTTDGLAPRFNPTIHGFVLGLSAPIFTSGTKSIIEDGLSNPGVYAWMVTKDTDVAVSAINLTNSSKDITLPAAVLDGTGVSIYSELPWATIPDPVNFPAATTSSVSSRTLSLPAFSKAIIGEITNEPPSVTVSSVESDTGGSTPQEEIVNFRELSALPSGWVASDAVSLTFDGTQGLRVPNATNAWQTDYVYGPEFDFNAYSLIEVLVHGMFGATAIGIGASPAADAWGDFAGQDCIMFTNGGQIHNGTSGVHDYGAQDGNFSNFYRFRLVPDGSGNVTITYASEFNFGGFTDNGSYTMVIPAPMQSGNSQFIVDSGFGDSLLTQVRLVP